MKAKLIVLIALSFCLNTYSQDSYQFALIQNDSYNYSVAAVPNFDSSGDETVVSFIFTIMLPDDGTSVGSIDLVNDFIFHYLSLDSTASYTAAQINDADPGENRNATIVASSPSGTLLPSHVAGDIIPIVSFNILGTPTTGEISILDNNSNLAIEASSQGLSMDSYFSVDLDGPSTTLQAEDAYSGQAETTSFSFSTLGVQNEAFSNVSLFPNPVKNKVTIILQDNATYSLLDINGRQVKKGELLDGNNHLDLSILSNGVYIMKLKTDKHITIKKIIKE